MSASEQSITRNVNRQRHIRDAGRSSDLPTPAAISMPATAPRDPTAETTFDSGAELPLQILHDIPRGGRADGSPLSLEEVIAADRDAANGDEIPLVVSGESSPITIDDPTTIDQPHPSASPPAPSSPTGPYPDTASAEEVPLAADPVRQPGSRRLTRRQRDRDLDAGRDLPWFFGREL
jgi:hypothetical protein